ncbi:MAG: hypothetical protein IIY87_05835 [Bacteroidales bacterium]|nr:hypothetical protein [Bacteroidales bacterium]
MKNLQHKIPWAMMLLFLLALVSCRKDKDILTNIGGVIEDSPVEDDSKVYLSDRERWLRWETGDEIFVWSTDHHSGYYTLDAASNKHLTGTFSSTNSEITANSTIYAFYPSSMTSGDAPAAFLSDPYTLTLNLPASHSYRENSNATAPDSSFGAGAMPMVAYRPDHDAHELFFHSLAGILRFQLYAGPALTHEATDEFTIKTITFEARNEDPSGELNIQLSGPFTITKSSIEDNQPQITPAYAYNSSDPNPEYRKVSITKINQKIGGTGDNKNNLFTFYLPLPAVADPYGPGSHKTTYHLKMHVYGTQNDGTKKEVDRYFVRTLTVPIRRLSVTMMPAMQIDSLSTFVGGTGSVGSPTIVGCGTEARPFQIYNADQLVYLRNRCNADQRVNGQKITKDTYIKICRSTITLVPEGTVLHGSPDTAVWTEGFSNFTGKMYFSSSAGENGGITNISGHPLFEKISSTGHVERVYVKGELTLNSGSGTFSPMCGENLGYMVDCHNRCNVTSNVGHNLAGLCVTNSNTIVGGANDALLHSTGGNVAGICYTNSGTLQGNFSLSSAVPQGDNIAGICYSNEVGGIVADCQVSANIHTVSSTGNWGVVVFENSGTVQNCRSVGTIVFTTSGSIGGVVHTNTGTVHDCSLKVTLRGGSGSVGGIVAVMNGGTLYNCYADDDYMISGTPRGGASEHATYAGGIVGWLHDGAVYNCYNRCPVSGAINSGTVLGRIDQDATIENCWSDYSTGDFLGDKSSRADQGELGPFCFSAKSSDTSWNCVYILKKWYRIMVPYSMRNETALENFYVNYYTSPGVLPTPVLEPDNRPTDDYVKYLYAALNYWVSNIHTGDNSYNTWTNTLEQSYDVYPIFNPSKHYRPSKKSFSSMRNSMMRSARKAATRR